MKYLKLFQTKAEREAFEFDETNTPNVNLCEEDSSVQYVEKIPPYDPFNGHGYADLGITLANGNHLLFATCNVGATKPEDPGLYYMWGETEGHEKNSGYEFTSANYTAKGLNTISTNLSRAQDAARTKLGGSWRMPTKAEFEELLNNTNKSWTTINGVAGRKFANKTDASKYIFIPAAGDYYGTTLENSNTDAFVWSSTFLTIEEAYYLYFYVYVYDVSAHSRYLGMSVRGVIELTEEGYQKYVVNSHD